MLQDAAQSERRNRVVVSSNELGFRDSAVGGPLMDDLTYRREVASEALNKH